MKIKIKQLSGEEARAKNEREQDSYGKKSSAIESLSSSLEMNGAGERVNKNINIILFRSRGNYKLSRVFDMRAREESNFNLWMNLRYIWI
jgi:hypothetical protein